MPKFAFAVPVVPGKDAKEVPALLRSRMGEYEESRRRHGISMERTYLQPTPMGTFVVVYIEAERDFAGTMASIAASDLAIDRDFNAKLGEVHGFDDTEPPSGPPPEVIGDWRDPEVSERRAGLAFVAPVRPGGADAARAFAHEATVVRRDEMSASRRALGINAETEVLNTTPEGEVLCVYLEGVDPVAGNRGFAASQSEFDAWFKQQCRSVFPPEIDFNQPLPPIEQLWDWHRATVSA